MDFRDKVFISVAKNLSFFKAAGNLNNSQPAVTRHIKELEERYNTNLFERKRNKIYLTEAGERIYNVFKQIAREYRELDFEIGQMHNSVAGEFKIRASSTISQYLIPKVIASFHKRYPKIQIFLLNGNSFEMERAPRENQVDMALVENSSSQPGIRYKDFMDDELIVVTGSNSVYAKREEIRKDELLQIPIVLWELGSGTLEVIKEAFSRQKIDFESLNTLIHLGSTEAIKFICNPNREKDRNYPFQFPYAKTHKYQNPRIPMIFYTKPFDFYKLKSPCNSHKSQSLRYGPLLNNSQRPN